MSAVLALTDCCMNIHSETKILPNGIFSAAHSFSSVSFRPFFSHSHSKQTPHTASHIGQTFQTIPEIAHFNWAQATLQQTRTLNTRKGIQTVNLN